MRQPTNQWVEVDTKVDDSVTFYSRMFGENRVVIIPKATKYETFEFTETPTTYVITIKALQNNK